MARPSYDVEDILVNFERRIKRDRTLEGVEERTQERYLHLLRQTLEEDRATFSTFQTRRSGRSREEEPSFTSFGKVQASNSDHMFSTGGEVPPPPSQTSRLGNWSFPAKPSGEDFREESHVMRPWCSSRIPASSMSVPIKGFVEPALKYSEPLVPESNFAYQDWPPAELNFDPNEDPQVLFDDYKLVVNGEGSSEVSVAPQPEADRNTTRERDLAQDQFDGNYIMGEDLMEISDLLQLENELQDAAGP